MSTKIIKDSIHGYITLDETFSYIIDSPEFQRLKYIEQGSFRVLYPAARHDRFIHSLGTYHLACKFAQNFIKNIQEDLLVFVFCPSSTACWVLEETSSLTAEIWLMLSTIVLLESITSSIS